MFHYKFHQLFFFGILASVGLAQAGVDFRDYIPTEGLLIEKLKHSGMISEKFQKHRNALGEGFLITLDDSVIKHVSNLHVININDISSVYTQKVKLNPDKESWKDKLTLTKNELKECRQEKLRSALAECQIDLQPHLEQLKSLLNDSSSEKYFIYAQRFNSNKPSMVLVKKDEAYQLLEVCSYDSTNVSEAAKNAVSALALKYYLIYNEDSSTSKVTLSAWFKYGLNKKDAEITQEQLATVCETTRPWIKYSKITPFHSTSKFGYQTGKTNFYFLTKSQNNQYGLLNVRDAEVAIAPYCADFILKKDVDNTGNQEQEPSAFYDYSFKKRGLHYIWTKRARYTEKGIFATAAVSSIAALRYLVAPAAFKIFTKLKVQLEAQREKIVKGLQRQQLVAQVKRWVVTPEYPVYFVPDERQQAIANEFNHLIKEKLGMPTGLLFSGAFGDGKSTLVKYMAKKAQEECDALFLEVSSAKIAAAVNSGTKNDPVSISDVMTGLFEAIRQLSQDNPVIVFMDEIDMYLQDDKTMKTKEQLDLCHAIVTSLPDLVSTPNVYLIAAVNNLKEVSVKLLNPHRFGKNVFLDNPGQKDREILYSRLLACSKMKFSAEEIKAISEAAGPGTLNNKVFATPISRAHIVNSLKEAISEVAFVRLSENDPLREKIKNRANFALKKETMVGANRSSLGSRLKAFFGLKASASVDKIARQEEDDDAQFSGKTNSLLDMLQVFTPRYKQLFTKVLLEKIYNAHVSYAFTLKLAGERLQVLDDLREMYGSTF